MSRPTTSQLALLLALPFTFSSCGQAQGSGDGNDVALVIFNDDSEAGPDAAISGVLGVTNGCVTVGELLIAWPKGTRVTQADPLEIDIPGYGPAQAGQSLAGSGGGISDPDRTNTQVPEACADLEPELTQFRPVK